jgi:hypothetical protein
MSTFAMELPRMLGSIMYVCIHRHGKCDDAQSAWEGTRAWWHSKSSLRACCSHRRSRLLAIMSQLFLHELALRFGGCRHDLVVRCIFDEPRPQVLPQCAPGFWKLMNLCARNDSFVALACIHFQLSHKP